MRPVAGLERRRAPRIKCVYARCTLQHGRLMRIGCLQRMSSDSAVCSTCAKSRAYRTGMECTADWCQFTHLSRRLPTVLHGDAVMALLILALFNHEHTDHHSTVFFIVCPVELQARAHLQCLARYGSKHMNAVKYSALFACFTYAFSGCVAVARSILTGF